MARCTVERLMREDGLAGAVRGKVKRTTIADPAGPRARDLVRRDFAPLAPDRLWVADITYVSTWAGWVYVAFVIDAFARRIIGWRCGRARPTQLVLDALEQAVWTRDGAGSSWIPLWRIRIAGRRVDSSDRRNTSIMEVFDGSWPEAEAGSSVSRADPVAWTPGGGLA